ncbi:MAG: hypothetical protein HY843_03260, partial [Bdellovibrio sp.]|nr:hypothetical protein [Bdellovibrio sp.]
MQIYRHIIYIVISCTYFTGCINDFSVKDKSFSLQSTNSGSTTQSDQSSSTHGNTSQSTPNESELAKIQCSNLDPKSKQFQFCLRCRQYLIETKCQNKSFFNCDSPTFNDFTSLLNQCISQSTVSGELCPLQCPSGKVLDDKKCACINTNYQTNILTHVITPLDQGPPLVSLTWPYIRQQVIFSNTTACTAKISPILFEVKNRGGSDFYKNIYTVEKDNPLCDPTSLSDLVTPTFTSFEQVEASFNIHTQSFSDYDEILNSISNWTPQPPVSTSQLAYNRSDRQFFGPFPGQTTVPNNTRSIRLDLGEQAPAHLLIQFELFLFYPNGVYRYGGDEIILSANNIPLFHNYFLDLNIGNSHTYPFKPTMYKRTYYENFSDTPPVVLPICGRRRHFIRPVCQPVPPPNPIGKYSVYLISIPYSHTGGPLALTLTGASNGIIQDPQGQNTGPLQNAWGFNNFKVLKQTEKN